MGRKGLEILSFVNNWSLWMLDFVLWFDPNPLCVEIGMTVYSKDDVRVTFKDGTKIKA